MESSSPTNMQPGPRSAEWGGLSRHLLSRVDELQEVLSKERQNYITLQQLTYRLQEANIQAKDEIRCLRSEKQALEDQMNRQTVAYEKSLLAKTEEAEEMRRQVSPAQSIL
uniref:Uncharacterized protein n=1 Tax=Tetraodon nigroviridis TaxID=99883 RepID=H3C7L2_TETNG